MANPVPEGLPPVADGEIIVERWAAARSRDPDFRAAGCYGYYNHRWWRKSIQMWVASRPDDSECMMVSEAIATFGNGTYLYIKIDQNTDPDKPRRRCLIGQFLQPDVISLLKLAPNNATFRARVMASLGEMPPKELDTYEKIKDWIEFTFPKGDKVVTPTPAQPQPPLQLRISGSEEEYGRCRYTRKYGGNGMFTMTSAEVDALIRSGRPGDLSELVSMVHEKMEQYYQSIREEVAESTDGHEVQDGSSIELDYSSSDLKGYLRRAARGVIDEEDWEDFGLI